MDPFKFDVWSRLMLYATIMKMNELSKLPELLVVHCTIYEVYINVINDFTFYLFLFRKIDKTSYYIGCTCIFQELLINTLLVKE